MSTFAQLFLSAAADGWSAKLWEFAAEAAANASDRATLTHGLIEPFNAATSLTLTNAALGSGYCANTQSIASYTNETSGASFSSSSAIESGYPLTNLNTGTGTVSFNTGSPDLRITFASAIVLKRYTVGGGGYSYPAAAWTLYGSTDNATWTALDTRSAQSTGSTTVNYDLSSNTTAYKYYKLVGANSTRFQLAYLYFYSAVYAPDASTILLASMAVSGATIGKIIFRGYNADATAALDVGNSGSNKLEVYPVISGTAGSALSFTSESLGSNLYRYTSGEFSLSGATSFGLKFQSFARTTAPNFRIYDACCLWL